MWLGSTFCCLRLNTVTAGITDGVKDLFYEPYMGLVEGPEEFMTGLSSGIKNFLGGTVGGTVGAGRRTHKAVRLSPHLNVYCHLQSAA